MKYAPAQRARASAYHGGPAATISPPSSPRRASSPEVVGFGHRLLVVLDHDHRVAEVAERLQRVEQAPVAALVETDGRFVGDGRRPGELEPICSEACAGLRPERRVRSSVAYRGRRSPGSSRRAAISLRSPSAMVASAPVSGRSSPQSSASSTRQARARRCWCRGSRRRGSRSSSEPSPGSGLLEK